MSNGAYPGEAVRAPRDTAKLETVAHAFEGLSGEAEGIRNTVYTILERLRGPQVQPPTSSNMVRGDKLELVRPLIERVATAGDRIQLANQQIRELLNELQTYI